ncbi:unnamed protein product [Tetraodon nigroviridis]|uniref:Chromosome 6 SCAF14768, whole genome shotgun sequence n=1 Tax=Tetraodon nigroviridis TaxID=99883 RepID=Q4S1P1_TETNG|nr:unnamed protein product [Tetraodon nigroviridis]
MRFLLPAAWSTSRQVHAPGKNPLTPLKQHMSAAGGEESSRRRSLDVQKWVWAPVSGRLQRCISLLQTRAESNMEPRGWKKQASDVFTRL